LTKGKKIFYTTLHFCNLKSKQNTPKEVIDMAMKVKQKSLELLLNRTLSYLQKDPEKNFQKIINNLDKLSRLLPLPKILGQKLSTN